MKQNGIGLIAFAVCVSALLASATHAQYQREYQTANDAAATASGSLVSYNDIEYGGCCDSGGCDSCSTGASSGIGGLGLGLGLLDRPGQFFAGAEYIYARASFSEAHAYVLADTDANTLAQFIEYDFDYESSYRFYGGYQFCDCGGGITFDYARYRSGAGFSATEGPNQEFLTPYEVESDGPGNETLSGNASVDIDSYGLSFSRSIPLGSPLACGGCDCGDTCNDSCCGCGDGCGCWCPAWDITWSAGLRFAEVGWSRNTQSTINAVFNQNGTGTTSLNFEGAGARVGLLGRRYFGKKGLLSAYARGDWSLLVGNMSITSDRTPRGAATSRIFESSGRRVIPVTEIEAGLTAHLGSNVTVSSGYFIAAWHDLGMRDTYVYENTSGAAAGGLRFPISHFDDANILGFDGFFARAEVAY